MKLDREYFKEKKTGKKLKGMYTICCGQEKGRDLLNKNNKADWALIEEHCEDHLTYYSNTETIEVVDVTNIRIEEDEIVLEQGKKLRNKFSPKNFSVTCVRP